MVAPALAWHYAVGVFMCVPLPTLGIFVQDVEADETLDGWLLLASVEACCSYQTSSSKSILIVLAYSALGSLSSGIDGFQGGDTHSVCRVVDCMQCVQKCFRIRRYSLPHFGEECNLELDIWVKGK